MQCIHEDIAEEMEMVQFFNTNRVARGVSVSGSGQSPWLEARGCAWRFKLKIRKGAPQYFWVLVHTFTRGNHKILEEATMYI